MKTLHNNQQEKWGRTSQGRTSLMNTPWLKGLLLFLAILLLGSLNVAAGYPPKKLYVLGVDGITIELLVKPEVAEEVPAGVTALFAGAHAECMDELINCQFDLSTMTKPEPDADDIVIDTKKIFREIMRENQARKK